MKSATLQRSLKTIDRTEVEELLVLTIEKTRRQCIKSFWTFCRVLAPEFYLPDRLYLKELCDTLQKLWERKLVRKMVCGGSKGAYPVMYHKMIVNEPPRFGKSRTLMLFCMWILGKKPTERIIYCSYNDKSAGDFSRYVRDGINETKNLPHQIVYSDIFPYSKIKEGNASFEKWALEGQFFSYIGAGMGGSITGKGGTTLIVDDPIKDAATAYNENAIDRIWTWYSGTFLSRKEPDAIEIINMTRWVTNDPTGRVLEGEDSELWYRLMIEAKDIENDKMTCDSILSRDAYNELQKSMDKNVFMANYHQIPLDETGRLYQELKTYTDLPVKPRAERYHKTHPIFPRDFLFDRIIAYVDTADEGDDFLCGLVAGEKDGQGWLIDVLYSKEGMEITEEETAILLATNKVGFCKIESNNGGRGFARAVIRIIHEQYELESERLAKHIRFVKKMNRSNYKKRNIKKGDDEYLRAWSIVPVKWFHQTENKRARIIANSNYVMQNIYFPHDWDIRWPKFYKAVTTYQREGTNKHDDAPDALTGLVEMITKSRPRAVLI